MTAVDKGNFSNSFRLTFLEGGIRVCMHACSILAELALLQSIKCMLGIVGMNYAYAPAQLLQDRNTILRDRQQAQVMP